MTPDISEHAFEEEIESALLRHGPDAPRGNAKSVRESPPAYGDDPLPGGYRKRRPEDYDRNLCLLPTDVVDFLLATQPQEWEKLKQHHGADLEPRFLGRLSREIARRGALDVLRNGVKDSGCKLRLACFRPRRQQAARRRRRGGAGDALADHRGVERALRPQPRPRAPRHAGADPRRPRHGRRPRRQRPREHARETAADHLETDDEFMRHLAQAVRDGLGDHAGTCIDPTTQMVDGRTGCLVSCQRSPEPVYLRWKGLEKTNGGDLHVRTGPASVRLAGEDAAKYVATRFGSRTARRVAEPPFPSPPGRAL